MKKQTDECKAFENLARHIFQVPKREVVKLEKRRKKRRRKK